MILDRIFGQTEERSGLKQPAGWFTDWLSGGKNHSGVSVNETSAMQLSAVSAAVSVISNGIASQLLQPFTTRGDRTEVAREHPTYKLLNCRANPHMSAFVFFQLLQSHALKWGNGYGWMDLAPNGSVAAIWPLCPWTTTILEAPDRRLICQTVIREKTINIDMDEVIHIKALGSDGIVGKSPIRQHAEEIGIQIAAQNFGAEFFGNGAVLQGVIEHPARLNDDSRRAIRDSFVGNYSGTGKRHGTAVLTDGMKYQRIGIPPEEAQFLETRRYGDTKIAQIYNVPPHMIGDLSKATFSNITEETINFVRRTLTPWFTQWEQELNYKLFSTNEQRRLSVKFDKSDILKGTPKDESEKDNTLINAGVITRNEARKARGLNPIDGLDEILVPLNMVEMSQAKKIQEGEDIEENALNADPLIKRFAEIFTNAESKVKEKGTSEKWQKDCQKFVERHLSPIAESLEKPELVKSFLSEYRKVNQLILNEEIIKNTIEAML